MLVHVFIVVQGDFAAQFPDQLACEQLCVYVSGKFQDFRSSNFLVHQNRVHGSESNAKSFSPSVKTKKGMCESKTRCDSVRVCQFSLSLSLTPPRVLELI